MNTNVGDMPLDVFSDYIHDSQGIEFPWEFLISLSLEVDAIGSVLTGNGYYPQAWNMGCIPSRDGNGIGIGKNHISDHRKNAGGSGVRNYANIAYGDGK